MNTKVLASGLDRHVLPINETRATVLNQPSKEQLELPFYNLLPKDPIELLKWKIYVRERCLHDFEFRELIDAACKQDICFYAATYCWVFEPRPPRDIPFTPWCDQADCLAWMAECVFTHRDLGCEKTRGIGWSVNIGILCSWLATYYPDVKIALTSKDDTVLDGPDANSLMGKVWFLLNKLPAWKRIGPNGKPIWKRTFDQHIMQNLANGAVIQGYAATDEKLRSLRFTVVIYDEFAFFPKNAQKTLNASVHTAPCRIFVSTWNGPDCAFHSMLRIEKSTMLRVQAYWWNNPERWKGCYTTEAGRLKIIDQNYQYPPDYPFVLDGLLRSPWVDYELRRAGSTVQSALEELYGLQAEGGRKLVKHSTIEIIKATVRNPWLTGELDCGGREPVFRTHPDGRVNIFVELEKLLRGGPFSAGCDLGFGHGASSSTLEIIDLASAIHAVDFADNMIDPVSFAQLVVDFLRWINGTRGDGHCHLDFEANGDQATSFGNELVRLGYGNIRERRYRAIVKGQDKSSYLGTRNKDGGLASILELERGIVNAELTIFSGEIMDELAAFDKDEDGRPVFPKGIRGHGDRVQGLGLAWGYARDRMIEPVGDAKEHAQDELKNFTQQRSRWGSSWRRSA